jgi:hypothetical protein
MSAERAACPCAHCQIVHERFLNREMKRLDMTRAEVVKFLDELEGANS